VAGNQPLGLAGSGFDARLQYARTVNEALVAAFMAMSSGASSNGASSSSSSMRPTVDSIVIGGAADLKELLDEELDVRLAPLVRATVPLTYGGRQGFRQLIVASAKLLANVHRDHEATVYERFYSTLMRDETMVAVGIKEVRAAIDQGAAETVIVHRDHELVGEFIDNVESTLNGARLEVLSCDSQETSMFLHGFDGLVAILRYAIPSLDDESEEEN
jgi:peptide subunit release factor 1 (eRF1)